MSSAQVVTRFAPSPSGEVHLGNVRTALFSFLLARAQQGRFLLRIEDTDAGRSSEAHVAGLLRDLSWLGLAWDGTPLRQSARADVYAGYLRQLEQRGLAYPCYCTPLELELERKAQLASGRPPRYSGRCRNLSAEQRAQRSAQGLKATLRFRIDPAGSVGFDDIVYGPQHSRRDDIGDFVIRREDGSAAFFFANALDDALSGVTHVLRGEDHLTNSYRQLMILEALALPRPRYGHVALLLGTDGTPLSKRNGATSLRELAEAGYAPLALCNQLFRLGHSSADNSLLSLEQMAQHFDTSHLQRAPAHFDLTQLKHWQTLWVQSLRPEAAREWLRPLLPAGLSEEQIAAFVKAVLPNTVLPPDAAFWAGVIHSDALEYSAAARERIRLAGPAFFSAAADVAGENTELAALRAATGCKGAEFYLPLRAALTGTLHGPDLVALLAAMPPVRIRARLLDAARGM